jgi:hypothetical protein
LLIYREAYVVAEPRLHDISRRSEERFLMNGFLLKTAFQCYSFNNVSRFVSNMQVKWNTFLILQFSLGPTISKEKYYHIQARTYTHKKIRTYVSTWKIERQSNLRTGLDRPWGFQQAEAPRYRHMKVARLSAYAPAAFNPPPRGEIFLILISVRVCVFCDRKDYVHLKTPMTPSIIEPATFRLVRHCLNHLRHGVPYMHTYIHTLSYFCALWV